MPGGCEQTAAGRGGVGSRMLQVRIENGATRSRDLVVAVIGVTAVSALGVMSTEAGHECARARGARATLADRIGQRHQFVILIGMGGQRPGMAHEFPATRSGDAPGVFDA
jgi:hypothetical protein